MVATMAMGMMMVMAMFLMLRSGYIDRLLPRGRNKGRDSGSDEPKDGASGSGGYIIFDMPDEKKGMFHDLLKGFEDYAKLRGYNISFSIDNSRPNRVAFKFTLSADGINVSTQTVRRDINDYITRVQRGDNLDNLPVVLPPEEHAVVLTSLKNRISFLEHNYNLQKNAAEFYQKLLRDFPVHGYGVLPAQNIYLQAGERNQAPTYHALNSPQTVQGAGNRLIGNRVDQSIHIADSFNELKEQVEAVSQLERVLASEISRRNPTGGALAGAQEAEKCLRKVREELEEEKEPDPNRVLKWLEQTKYALKAFGLTKEIIESGQKLEDAFHLSDWIGSLIS